MRFKRPGVIFLEEYRKMKRYMKLRDKNKFLAPIFNFLIEWKRRDFIRKFGRECSPGATIKKVYFLHPLGLVIGRDAILEDNVVVMSNVTFGALRADNYIGKQHIKEGTLVGTGARILGTVTIGKNCVVGANAVVTKDVPDNHIVIGHNIIKPKKENEEYIKFNLLEKEYKI